MMKKMSPTANLKSIDPLLPRNRSRHPGSLPAAITGFRRCQMAAFFFFVGYEISYSRSIFKSSS
jgi:hypothetical protein